MNTRQTISKRCRTPALLALVLSVVAGSAVAATYDLVAMPFTKTMPGGASVTMWGFALDGASCTAPPCLPSVPGPDLVVPTGDTSLTVNLRNALSGPGAEPVSLVIPGQFATMTPVKFTDGQGRQRVRSFTAEAAVGASQSYTWNTLKPGTFLYHSGTHPQVQVQMGLYGAVSHDAAAGQAYAGVPYHSAVTVLFSEVDPALHAAVAAGRYGQPLPDPLPAGMTAADYPSSTIDYAPKYFLINGEAHPDPSLNLTVGNAGQTTLLRLLNAGLQSRSPMLQGLYMHLIAEDGNRYPYPREQYAAFLPALKTADVLITPAAAATYPLYDRRLAMGNPGATGSTAGGMLAFLTVGDGTNTAPTITSTAITTATVGVAYSYDVNASDPDAGDVLSYTLDVAPTGMTIDGSTGVISWTPGATGDSNVTVRATDTGGLFVTQSFTITVGDGTNTAPTITSTAITTATVGVAYSYDVNASDPDAGDVLSYTLDVAPTGMTIDGSTGVISWTPGATGDSNVTVRATDTGGLFVTQSFTITVGDGTTNTAPTITSTAITSATVGVAYSYDVNASDPDAGDVLSYTLDVLPAGMTIDGSTGVISWTPGATGGSNVTVRATDTGGLFATQSFTINVQPAGTPGILLYFSTAANTAVPGVSGTADNADVYSWDGTSFARVFDATAAGLPAAVNVDAVKVVGSQIYLSFSTDTVVPGMGTVPDEDIVVYDGSSFSLFFDGSAAGLVDDSEDVDAFDILGDGSVLVSALGNMAVPGLAGTWVDKDVLRCIPTSSGPIASCTWSVHFDGSDVGLTQFTEDVDGVSAGGGNLYLSTVGAYDVAGLANATTDAGGDVFSCDTPVPGEATGCSSFSLYFRASDHGLAGNIDALSVP